MLSLDPAKLLVVLLVALVVLGPDKLPRAARQAGAAWSQLRQWRARLEEEVRGSFPDLPSTDTITQAVRSPLSFLDRLADGHAAGDAVATGTAVVAAGSAAGRSAPDTAAGAAALTSAEVEAAVPGAPSGMGPAPAPAPSPPAQPGPDASWGTGDHRRTDQPGLPSPRAPYDALRAGDPSMN